MKNKGRNLRMFVFINLFGIVLLSLSSYLLVFFQTSRAATGDPPESFHGSYTEGVPFWGSYALYQTISGTDQIVYCYDHLLDPMNGIMVLKGELTDKGLLYIIQNGYPNNPNICSGTYMDKYMVTQYAIWIYKDRYILGIADNVDGEIAAGGQFGKINLLNSFGEYSIAIQNLLAGAEAARNAPDPNYSLKNSTFTFSASGNNYVSSSIGIDQDTDFTSYTITSISAPAGYYLTTNTGRTIQSDAVTSTVFAKDETFQVIFPASGLTPNDIMVDMKITASATVSKAYMYAPETPGMQDGLLTTMYDEDVTASASLTGMIPLGQIKIIKTYMNPLTGETGTLGGAHLRITEEGGTFTLLSTTEDSPKIITGLLPGKTYLITETDAPAGYSINTRTYKVTITMDDCFASTDDLQVVTIQDYKIVVRLNKRDITTNQALPNAKVRITAPSISYSQEITTTSSYVEIPNVQSEVRYTVEEIEAPSGYMLPEEPFEFEISKEGLINVVNTSENYEVNPGPGIITITIKDRAYDQLPNTGGSGIYPYLFVGIVLVGVGISGYVFYRKKIRKENKRS